MMKTVFKCNSNIFSVNGLCEANAHASIKLIAIAIVLFQPKFQLAIQVANDFTLYIVITINMVNWY